MTKGLAIALGVSLLAHAGTGLYVYKLRADVTSAEAATTRAEGERDAALRSLETETGNVRTCKGANAGWELTTLELQAALSECQGVHAGLAAQGRAASARLAAQLAEAEATVDALLDRERVASRDRDCAALLDTRFADVCPGLSGGAQ